MPELQAACFSALLALGLYGALYLAQLLVADTAGIRRGHAPGAPADGGHDDAPWTFLVLRTLPMLAYYLDLRVLRSVAFALAMVALLVVLGAGLRSATG